MIDQQLMIYKLELDLILNQNELLNDEYGDKNKKKRVIVHVEKSPSASTSTEPSSSLIAPPSLTRIAPIIYFKLDPNFVKNKSALSKSLEEINRILQI